jgi:hypothetical protein
MRWRRLACEPLEDRRLLSVMDITPDPARLSADAGLEYLNGVMDQYHGERFWVYEDISSPGNHFHCRAKIPDEDAAVTTPSRPTPVVPSFPDPDTPARSGTSASSRPPAAPATIRPTCTTRPARCRPARIPIVPTTSP